MVYCNRRPHFFNQSPKANIYKLTHQMIERVVAKTAK